MAGAPEPCEGDLSRLGPLFSSDSDVCVRLHGEKAQELWKKSPN